MNVKLLFIVTTLILTVIDEIKAAPGTDKPSLCRQASECKCFRGSFIFLLKPTFKKKNFFS